MQLRDVDRDRFWSHVRPQEDGCWIYEGQGVEGPYGHVRISWQGRRHYAHRIAYMLANGGIGEGIVMHLCDVGGCCRPEHLRLGTIAENNRQRDERNRRTPFLPRGSRHWSAKFADRDISALRVARERGVAAKVLAEMYDVSLATIYNVWSGTHYGPPRAQTAGE